MRAVVLLSGGMDSTVVLYDALAHKYDVTALSFDYGQRHSYELVCATQITKQLRVPHLIQRIDSSYLTSPLLDANAPQQGNMYVPARNTLFLSYALALCETIKAQHIFIGSNADDFDGYPDCRPSYVAAFQNLANLAGQQTNYTIHAPLIHLHKPQIVSLGRSLGVDFNITSSCYSPIQHSPCGTCNACSLRQKALLCT